MRHWRRWLSEPARDARYDRHGEFPPIDAMELVRLGVIRRTTPRRDDYLDLDAELTIYAWRRRRGWQ